MDYVFKWAGETLRAVIIGVAVFAFTITGEGVDNVDDWEAWGRSLLTGAVPVASAIILTQLAKLRARWGGGNGS